MAGDEIRRRVFEFACRIVRMHSVLCKEQSSYKSLFSQLLRSATSVGANLEEAEAGQSHADFRCKIRISLKEARETRYWLRILSECHLASPERLQNLLDESNQIVAILSAISKKANEKGISK